MIQKIDEFIDLLSNFDTGPFSSNFKDPGKNGFAGVFNQYSSELPENSVRRENLRLYLLQIMSRKPDVLIIGEAPGYKGCRLTGVPFTSERILVKNENIFGFSKGYRITDENGIPVSEQTATIVWNVLAELMGIRSDKGKNYNTPKLPLFWNAFPFHPYKRGNIRSNRKPNREELKTGELFLRRMLEFSKFRKIIALGNAASVSLTSMHIPHTRIRHPSHGGKKEFEEGLKKILNYPKAISLKNI